MKRKGKKKVSATSGFEGQLWDAADALRGSMDAAEYKQVVLGLILPKYISDALEGRHGYLRDAVCNPKEGFAFANGSTSSNQSGQAVAFPQMDGED